MKHKGPLIVRLCNWVGEAVLSLPTLTMLTEQGYDLHLIGKRWAVSLFEGHGWTVHTRPAKRSDAIGQLKALRLQLSQQSPEFGKRPNMLLFTSSFSSALEARLAGLKPIGYNRESRGILLAHAVPYQAGLHAADNYWRVGSHFAGVTSPRPQALGLKPSTAHRQQAQQLIAAHALKPGFIILCPFSGAADTTGKKLWPAFPELARRLHEQGRQIILCPGPGEETQALADYPFAQVLTSVDLGTYAALSQHAAATISNDTGPGHLAAAAGTRVISVLGPDAAPMWWVQGEHVTVLRPEQGWPELEDVLLTLEHPDQP
ncbi:MAG: glycosyltransferase family 9 protein [Burkholderiales bacterium]|nr:glycosyltransferase family 9 protein [Burkholderiales bacterium]